MSLPRREVTPGGACHSDSHVMSAPGLQRANGDERLTTLAFYAALVLVPLQAGCASCCEHHSSPKFVPWKNSTRCGIAGGSDFQHLGYFVDEWLAGIAGEHLDGLRDAEGCTEGWRLFEGHGPSVPRVCVRLACDTLQHKLAVPTL